MSGYIPDVTTFDVPSWAASVAGYTFFLGFGFAIVIRLTRIFLRWVSSTGGPDHGPTD